MCPKLEDSSPLIGFAPKSAQLQDWAHLTALTSGQAHVNQGGLPAELRL